MDFWTFIEVGGRRMSKYEVGDKVILTVTSMTEMRGYPRYVLNSNFNLGKQSIDDYAEPLTAYTEPLEDTIQKYTVKIARLVMEKEGLKDENERLKAENEKMSIKIDAYELCSDQHEVEYNQAFNQGAEAAWELARKIILPQSQGGMNDEDYKEIFGSGFSEKYVIKNYTYSEAAAKVAEWEKAKEEIKRGDIIRNKYDTSSKFCVTDIGCDGHLYGVGRYGLIYSNQDPEYWEKTGRHIDIEGLLKQIGEE